MRTKVTFPFFSQGATTTMEYFSFQVSVCSMKSWMWIYFNILLVIWSSCYNTSVTGQHQVIGSSQDILVKVGDEVILPCRIEPPVNMGRKTVEWSRPDLKPYLIHLLENGHYKHGQDLNPLYKDRTSLFPAEIPIGNISLKLSRVKLSDEGTYRCSAPRLNIFTLIQLLVGNVSHPVISSNGPEDSGLSLTCDSGCWYPQPEMSWLDGDGNNITAGPSVTKTRSQHCYIVQRNVTVTLPDHVTCRVHLPRFNYTVETQYNISEDMIQRGPTVGVITGIVTTVIIIILIAAILGYLYWKKKQQTKRDEATPSIKCQGEPSESNEMINMSVEEEEQRDDIIPITSPEPRKWISVSERWRKQLEKLANIDDYKVTKVGSLLFVTDQEFRIAVGSDGVEVFLGLTDDGTEVAVKRMPKYFFHVLKNETDFLRLPKLNHPSIVRYVDFTDDENFGYLGLQLCEYTLAEYITEHNLSDLERKQLAHQFFQSLSILHGQDPKILHRDIKPQNVLIDIQSKARLSDFGISRELPKGQTTLLTKVAGTRHWKAKETMDNDQFPYKRSTDIQVAGMLIYYILSGGHHPFGEGARCEGNILDGKYNLDQVQDVVAKDLIERMINEDPKKRPRVEECLAHPLFWSNDRRVEYLRRIGKEVENCPDDDKDLITVLDQYAEQGQFNTWKHKLPLELNMDKMKSYPENSFGLLRFIHHLHEHYAEEAAGVDLMEMFPDLFGCVYQFAQKQDWNSRPTLKDMFHTEDVLYESPQTL